MLKVWTPAGSNPSSTGRHADEAAQQQARADEQDDRERRFADDQHRADALPVPIAGDRAAVFADAAGNVADRRAVPGRQHAAQHGRERGRAQRESDHRAVDTRFAEERNAERRLERGNALARPRRKRQPGEPTGKCQQTALDEHASHEADASGAKCRADRELAASTERSRQHEIRHVDADDEQHETDGAEQHEERRAHVTDERPSHLVHGNPRVAIGAGKGLRLSRGERAHLLARLFERHARRQPANHVEVVRATLRREVVGREALRQPELGIERELEPAWHHADDAVGGAIERDRSTDRVRIGAEPP